MSLTTTVVGAGPAGLLFCALSRILFARQNGDSSAWTLRLFDKRDAYARTHRLRMDPAPYRTIQRDLDDPRFDAFIGFLEAHGFSPEVDLLEAHLCGLVEDLGIRKERRAIGTGPDEVSLAELRKSLEADGSLPPGSTWTIVAADSVHSSVRELVRGSIEPVRFTHQRVARLRVVGSALPSSLGVVRQYRLSKVLGSVLDYRLNRKGYAEVDLFLTESEHAAVRDLGGTPRDPVPISSTTLSGRRAPLFRRIVEHLETGLTKGPCEVLVQSTFQLEHTVMPRMVFEKPDLDACVFLLGDAAVSLPFFRGMACLARCAHSLAHVHCDLAARREQAHDQLPQSVEDEVRREFFAGDRVVHFGARLLPGKILEVRPTVFRGQPAHVVLHRWLSLYGVHVLARDRNGRRHSLHSLAPIGRAAALADFEAQVIPERRYERESAAIKQAELSVVAARARLIRGLREFVRLSALLPFPIQSWWLSEDEVDEREAGSQAKIRGAPQGVAPADDLAPASSPTRHSAGYWLNVVLAASAAILALGSSLPGQSGVPTLAWTAWLALPIQMAGGIAYHAVLNFEPGPHRQTRNVWAVQIALVFVLGVASTVWASWQAGQLTQPQSGLWWLILAAAFVAGLYALEAVGRRWERRASFRQNQT